MVGTRRVDWTHPFLAGDLFRLYLTIEVLHFLRGLVHIPAAPVIDRLYPDLRHRLGAGATRIQGVRPLDCISCKAMRDLISSHPCVARQSACVGLT